MRLVEKKWSGRRDYPDYPFLPSGSAIRLAPALFRAPRAAVELRSNLAGEHATRGKEMVGPARFELAASSSRTRRSTKLSHGPTNLLQTTSGTYFARVKLRGKEIKQSLETNNLAVARRKLKDFKAKLDRTDPTPGRITPAELADFQEDNPAFCARYHREQSEGLDAGPREMARRRRPSYRKD